MIRTEKHILDIAGFVGIVWTKLKHNILTFMASQHTEKSVYIEYLVNKNYSCLSPDICWSIQTNNMAHSDAIKQIYYHTIHI